MYIVGGIIGILIGLAFIYAGFKAGTLWVEKDGQRAPVSGQPNWVMIIIGLVAAGSGIASLIKGS